MQIKPRPIVPYRSARTIALSCALAALTAGCVSGGQSGDLNGDALSEPDASPQKHLALEVDASTETTSERTAQAHVDSTSSNETADAAANAESNSDGGSSECDESCRQSLFSQLCHKTSALPCAGRDLEECMAEAASDYAQVSAVSEECVAGYLRATRCYAAGDWLCDELGREAGNEACSSVEQTALKNCERDVR